MTPDVGPDYPRNFQFILALPLLQVLRIVIQRVVKTGEYLVLNAY